MSGPGSSAINGVVHPGPETRAILPGAEVKSSPPRDLAQDCDEHNKSITRPTWRLAIKRVAVMVGRRGVEVRRDGRGRASAGLNTLSS